MLQKIPISLIILRFAIAFVAPYIAYQNGHYASVILFWLMIAGFLSDFFDGYSARLLSVSTERLRRLDTTVDRFFWVGLLASIVLLYPDFIASKLILISIIITFEIVNHLLCLLRFKKGLALHAIIAKFWGISLVLAFSDLLLTGHSAYLFDASLILGIIAQTEGFLIVLVLREWNHDIPTLVHAIKIRQGKEIKRHKIFNG